MNKDKAAQVAMPKAKKLSDSFIQSTNCQSFITKEEIVIRVYVGSILKLNVEGIVNASNGTLSHGGGIADVISRAAGYAFQQESDAYIQRNGSLKDGECCSTSAGNLQYKCVIHAIGPKWYDYPTDKRQCASVLQRTIENCLHEAETNGLISVAVPSISAGIYGVPKEICRQMYCQAVISDSKKQGKLTSLKEIHFIDKDQDMIAMVQQEFSKHLTCIQQKPSTEPVGQTPKKKESTFNKQYMTRVGFKVQILEGDITKLRVDAIVCRQDEQCQSRGMIARAIENVNDNVYKRNVTGMKMIQKCEVRLCKASPKTLPFTYVLHTVPPRFDKNSAKDSSKFKRELQIIIHNIIRLSNDRQDISTDGLETQYAIFSSVLAAEIMKATQSSWLNSQEIIIVTSEWGMAYAIAEQLDKEQGLTQVTSFQRSRRRQNKE
ncbi:protein mono-ADP-ribosyltransferase PARP9-like [Mytilus edulis]|uniref:protein mono-ADP-ribosyltransferase PARP9-like n=1 Tax=Mytilus edulis TaxID=6550 RepID=UPI0039EE89F8